MKIVILISIISCFVLLVLYILWLIIFVFGGDLRGFFHSPKSSQPEPERIEKKEVSILGKTQVNFLDKLPEPEPEKPVREEELKSVPNDENGIIQDAEIKERVLSEDEKAEILKSQEPESYWEDEKEDEFSTSCSIDEIYDAAKLVSGQKELSEENIAKTRKTLKNAPTGLLELFALHAVNEKKIKDMLGEFFDKPGLEINAVTKMKLKDFVVEDYIA